MAVTSGSQIEQLLGDEAEALLTLRVRRASPRTSCTCPGPDFIDRVWSTVRPAAAGAPQPRPAVHHRPAGRQRLPVDPARRPGHRALGRGLASPRTRCYFDPRNLVELAIEGGCNAVATTFGVLGAVARRYAHRIPFIVKLNHNELLTYPEQVRPDHVRLGAPGLRPRRGRRRRHGLLRLRRVRPARSMRSPRPSRRPTRSGMFTVLWCYLRNSAFKTEDGVDYAVSADLTGQANHLGVTIQADIIKQKLPENNGGYNAVQGLRQDQPARLRRAHHRQPDRPHPLAGRELLHGPRRR